MSGGRSFTIIEIMIVVVMIAILTSIAIPATNYVTRARSGSNLDAALAASEVGTVLQDQRTYVGACAPAPAPLPGGLKYFGIACTALTNAGYLVTATGNCGGGVDASMCGFSYSIDQGNNRITNAVPAGWSLPAGNCWVTKQGGQC